MYLSSPLTTVEKAVIFCRYKWNCALFVWYRLLTLIAFSDFSVVKCSEKHSIFSRTAHFSKWLISQFIEIKFHVNYLLVLYTS